MLQDWASPSRFEGEEFIEKARSRNWLLQSDSVATPASVTSTEDFQMRLTLEPLQYMRIDLNASRSRTTAKSIHYSYTGTPTTETAPSP